MDGSTSGVVHCDDTQSLNDWVQCINHNIVLLNHQNVSCSLGYLSVFVISQKILYFLIDRLIDELIDNNSLL